MKCHVCIKLTLIAITFLFLTSCATTGTLAYYQAKRNQFTKEMDEPSARAQLIRVSPEQSSVMFRFEISPDGQNIVYTGFQSGGGEKLLNLWKIPTGGGGSPVKITSGGASDYYYPSFTSDGNYIVYACDGQLWKVRSDGAGGKMRIPGTGNGTDTAPNVSKYDKLVFVSVQYSQGGGLLNSKSLIWTCNLDGGELTQIKEGSDPRWSPDGKKIVFGYNGEIWVVDSDGTNLMQLTNTAYIQEVLPSFSPDGKQIVYTSNEGKNGKPSTDLNIWYMDADGSSKTQLTELDSWDSWPVWSSQGIFFLSARALQANKYIQRIWRLKL